MATNYIPVVPTGNSYKLAFPATEDPQPNGEATLGNSDRWAREDHVHPGSGAECDFDSFLGIEDPQPNGEASPGTSKRCAREDHVHPESGAKCEFESNYLAFAGTADPQPDGEATSGDSDRWAREDHVHPGEFESNYLAFAGTADPQPDGEATSGDSDRWAREDHVHPDEFDSNYSALAGTTNPQPDGKASSGDSNRWAREDHVHPDKFDSNYSALAGTTNPQPDGKASSGDSNRWAREDHVHPDKFDSNYSALAGTTNPQPDGKASSGASNRWAREDHVHPDEFDSNYSALAGTANPQPDGEASSGDSNRWARENHVHPESENFALVDHNHPEYEGESVCLPNYAGHVTVNITGAAKTGVFNSGVFVDLLDTLNAQLTIADEPNTVWPVYLEKTVYVPANKRWRENKRVGQSHLWSFSGTWTFTQAVQNVVMVARFYNPKTGVGSETMNYPIPGTIASGVFKYDFKTVATAESIATGEGYVFEVAFFHTSQYAVQQATVALTNVTRISMAGENGGSVSLKVLEITDENEKDYVIPNTDGYPEGHWLVVPPDTELIYFDTTQRYGNLWGIRPTPGTEFNSFHRLTVIGAFFRQFYGNIENDYETEGAGVPYGTSYLFYSHQQYSSPYPGDNYPYWVFVDLIFVDKTKTWYSKCY